MAYQNASETEKTSKQKDYERHIKNKTLSRTNKEDKNKAKVESDFCAACFDLEQVLLTPHSFESSLYYKRRLSTYNFTIYDMGTTEGYCFVWNEAVSSRGACEIVTCVFNFIEKMTKKGKKKFVFYSDNCTAQNKNKYYLSMLWYCLKTFNLDYIKHKYLEKGHTQSENDSVHAAIEATVKHLSIYTTAQGCDNTCCKSKKAIYSERNEFQ